MKKSETLGLMLDAEGAWPEIKDRTKHVSHSLTIGVIPKGTSKGRAAVAVRIDLPDGSSVIGFTTAKLFVSAAEAIKARYGPEMEQS